MAAKMLGRNFIGYETNKSYFDIAESRLTMCQCAT
ncbi:MAG: site-specific DNA-methyltransferase [Paludibacter sp.]|nr:site-specific DNA-methyltransferase [Paludibacter sp.]